MRLHEHHKSSLFILEMIFSIFILAFSAAACTHVFSLAQNLRSEAREYNDCQLLFSNICEQLTDSAEHVEPVSYFDADLHPTDDPIASSYKTNIQLTYEDHLACAEIEIYKLKNSAEKQLLQEEIHFLQ